MEYLPCVTCAGNQQFFSKLHPYLTQVLPSEPYLWRRSYGRPARPVRIRVSYTPFDVDSLPRRRTERRLTGSPLFHIFWVDCDLDRYKHKVKDELHAWSSALKALHIADWLIVVVVHDENRVKSKLLRSSVFNKVKHDFCTGASDRCVLFLEPFKHAPNSEQWTTVIGRIRSLLLQAYGRALTRFEDSVRVERERRTETDWNFKDYFLLQEEISLFYQTMELYEESLVQYDELDALFSQFIINHAAGDSADWLMSYTCSAESWEGLSLEPAKQMYKRALIKEGKVTLLDFRTYLFACQCSMLVHSGKPWEAARRTIPFVHVCLQDLKLLQSQLPVGAEACWVFLTCMELLSVCNEVEGSTEEAYSSQAANLWKCAHTKLHDLGVLCGLMPDREQTSDQMRTVVNLIAGIGETTLDPSDTKGRPQDRLRSALTSSEVYKALYLELCELTMGTYKYVGQIRTANMLGKRLASFYLMQGNAVAAETFLFNSLSSFEREGWAQLETDTWRHIALCEHMLGRLAKCANASANVAASKHATDKERREAFQQFLSASARLDHDVVLNLRPGLEVVSVTLATDQPIVKGREYPITLVLNSRYPEKLHVKEAMISIKKDTGNPHSRRYVPRKGRGVFQIEDEGDSLNPAIRVWLGQAFNSVERVDSHGFHHRTRDSSEIMDDYSQSFRFCNENKSSKVAVGDSLVASDCEHRALDEAAYQEISLVDEGEDKVKEDVVASEPGDDARAVDVNQADETGCVSTTEVLPEAESADGSDAASVTDVLSVSASLSTGDVASSVYEGDSSGRVDDPLNECNTDIPDDSRREIKTDVDSTEAVAAEVISHSSSLQRDDSHVPDETDGVATSYRGELRPGYDVEKSKEPEGDGSGDGSDGNYRIDETIPLVLFPGRNTISLQGSLPSRGNFRLNQLCVRVGHVTFLQSKVAPNLKLVAQYTRPTLEIVPTNGFLLAGVPNHVTIRLWEGSESVGASADGALLMLVTSHGLKVDDFTQRRMVIKAIEGRMDNGQVTSGKLVHEEQVMLLTDLGPVTEGMVGEGVSGSPRSSVMHKVTAICDDFQEELVETNCEFIRPFSYCWSVHTAGTKKFLKVRLSCVEEVQDSQFLITDVMLAFHTSSEAPPTSFNQSNYTLSQHEDGCFVWLLNSGRRPEEGEKVEFSFSYSSGEYPGITKTCSLELPLSHIETLYQLETQLTPSLSSYTTLKEYHLTFTVRPLSSESNQTPMKYFIESDKVWAISGGFQSGVTTVSEDEPIRVKLVPLVSGHLHLPKVTLCNTASGLPHSPHSVYHSTAARQVLVVSPS